jgi:hypothetical protein
VVLLDLLSLVQSVPWLFEAICDHLWPSVILPFPSLILSYTYPLHTLTLLSNSRTYAPLPLSRLQQYLASGRLDPTLPIGIGEIVRSNLIHGISGFSGVKLLGEPDTSLPLPPLELNLSRFSKSAAAAVIEAGGKVTAVYHNRLGLRQEVWPEKFVGREVEAARPIRKSDIRESGTTPQAFREREEHS